MLVKKYLVKGIAATIAAATPEEFVQQLHALFPVRFNSQHEFMNAYARGLAREARISIRTTNSYEFLQDLLGAGIARFTL
jgi:hypothetical protein